MPQALSKLVYAMRRRKAFSALGAALLVITSLGSNQTALSVSAPPAKSIRLAEGVIVDPSDDQLFVRDPSGYTSAVDVASGNVEWSSIATTKPLVVLDGMLIAQAETSSAHNVLNIVALDFRNRGKVVTSKSARLPPQVDAGIDHNAQGLFRAEAQVIGEDVDVSWQFETVRSSGRPYAGSNILLENSATATIRPGSAIRDKPPPVPDPEATPLSGTIRFNLSSKAARPKQIAIVPPSQLMSRFAPVLPEAQSPFLTLNPGEEGYVSADGLAVLQSRRVGDDTVWNNYEWTIVDRKDGRPIANFRAHVRIAPFVVVSARVVYVDSPFVRQVGPDKQEKSPLSVRAVDTNTGSEVWSHAVRDTSERGPMRP